MGLYSPREIRLSWDTLSRRRAKRDSSLPLSKKKYGISPGSFRASLSFSSAYRCFYTAVGYEHNIQGLILRHLPSKTQLVASSRLFLKYVASSEICIPSLTSSQGLPICVALSLTVIARRMAKRQVLVKNLATIETLGCMSVLCSDKTGTLTAGKMVG